jgi:hypothetical protein
MYHPYMELALPISHDDLLPFLLPWKEVIYYTARRNGRASVSHTAKDGGLRCSTYQTNLILAMDVRSIGDSAHPTILGRVLVRSLRILAILAES